MSLEPNRSSQLGRMLPCVLFLFASHALAQGREGRPNFLLIVLDDLGATDLGCYGSEIGTPHLDALAGEGVRFDDFHTSASCSPTRSMLLSGTDNHLAGLGTASELLTADQRGRPGYEGHLNRRVVSLAEILRDAGYHTYLAGKWHLGREPDQFPHARGFERSFSLMSGGASHFPDKGAEYTRNGQRLEKLPRDFYSSRSYSDFLIDAIREHRGDGKPFLAYLSLTAPHDPLHVPEPWLSKYRGEYDDGYEALRARRILGAKRQGVVLADAPPPPRSSMLTPWDSLSSDDRALEARRMEVYAGMVDAADYHIGRVLGFLRDIGEYENTMIFVMSDNGPWASDDSRLEDRAESGERFDGGLENAGHPGSALAHGVGWALASAGPYDLFQTTAGRGGLQAPLIVAGPAVRGAGRTVEAFVYVTDLLPTMLELAGVSHPSRYRGRDVLPMRGRSFAGLISGRAENVYAPDETVSGEMAGGRWIRQGNLKAVLVPEPHGSARWELYEVSRDPGETRDLAPARPDKLAELATAWDRYAEEVGVWMPE